MEVDLATMADQQENPAKVSHSQQIFTSCPSIFECAKLIRPHSWTKIISQSYSILGCQAFLPVPIGYLISDVFSSAELSNSNG
eukprot:scaffold274370_cov52-Prasinocladus_malaysianus.AAC.1